MDEQTTNPVAQLETAEQANQAEQDEFEAGFTAVLEEVTAGATPEPMPEAAPESVAVTPAVSAQQPVTPTVPVQQPAPSQPVQISEQAPPEQAHVAARPAQTPPAAVAEARIDEAIREELTELEKLNPSAAALARENSRDGEMLRKRLAEYGADLALDRAERVLDRREARAQAEMEAVIHTKNQQFYSAIQRDHADFMSMDAVRRQGVLHEVETWITTLPYGEAAQLVPIFLHGDGEQVSALLTRFKQARASQDKQTVPRKTPDPTAALAVSGRGAPLVPADIGGKDDFETGWNS